MSRTTFGELYPTQPGPLGGWQRYVVLIRNSRDLSTSPSEDEYSSHAVWAQDPYDAAAVAQILLKDVRGIETRRIVGLEEWPLEMGEPS